MRDRISAVCESEVGTGRVTLKCSCSVPPPSFCVISIDLE
jgi:hypothetical protein